MIKGTLEFIYEANKLEEMRLLRDIDKSNITWSIKQMFKMYKNGKFDFNIEFQRPSMRWNKEQQSMLIDSIVRGYPIPAIFARKNADGTYVILDGKQRMQTTIFRYLEDEFSLIGLDPIPFEELDDDKKPTGVIKYYDISGIIFSQLPETIQDIINDYSVTIYYLEAGNGGELASDITRSVFTRLNNGAPLSRKERNVANCSDFQNFMEMGRHDLFGTILSDKAKESKNQVTILMKMHMMLFCEELQDVSFGPDDMTEAMKETYTTEDERREMVSILDKMLEVYNLMEDKKSIRKRWTAETHLVSLAPWFRKAIQEDISSGMLADYLSEAYATATPISASYTEFSRAGSGKTYAIVGRNAEIARVWKEFFEDSVADFEDMEEEEFDGEEAEVIEVTEPETDETVIKPDDAIEPAKSEIANAVEYRYGMRNRPAAPGAQPDGFLCFEDDEMGQ